MLQKFALAFRSRTLEFFADDGDSFPSFPGGSPGGELDSFSLLDATEDFITGQKVVVLKSDPPLPESRSPTAKKRPSSPVRSETHISGERLMTAHTARALLSSLFATISCFKASYLQFQVAHDPFDEEGIKIADLSVVSHLEKLSDIKQFVRSFGGNVGFNLDALFGSSWESRVQENQTTLRTLEIAVNRLQSEIDVKDSRVVGLKERLDRIRQSTLDLSKKLLSDPPGRSIRVVFSVTLFASALDTARGSVCCFTKILMELMRRAGWDLGLAAASLHPDVEFSGTGHARYALISFVFLNILEGFESERFGTTPVEQRVIDHVSSGPMQAALGGEFSIFCGKKYERLINAAMESSAFSGVGGSEVFLSSLKSLSMFYEAFVKMASSVWVLHTLSSAYDPPVKIFRPEKEMTYSLVSMEDAVQSSRRHVVGEEDEDRWRVGFSVVPGFIIGKTFIQSRVYLTRYKPLTY